MLKLFWYLISAIIIVALVTILILNSIYIKKESEEDKIALSIGDIYTTSKVTGYVESNQITKMSFPVTGIIQYIYKNEGDKIQKDDILASLINDSIVSEYNSAVSNIKLLRSLKKEIIRGPQKEDRDVTDVTVYSAEQNLKQTETEQQKIVDNAYKKMLSTDLEAVPQDLNSNDEPPEISGNYNCETEGEYIIYLFRSNSSTGYSYRLSGLETGTFNAWTEVSSPLGSCGLYIKLGSNLPYNNGYWKVSVPNKNSSSYLTNYNDYQLLLKQRDNIIEKAKINLELTSKNATYKNSKPTTESIEQIDAKIEAAEHSLKGLESKIRDYVIKAPFDGIITDVNMRMGETSDFSKNINLIGNDSFVLKIKIPEIDITEVNIGDKAIVSFDASPNEKESAEIIYISPVSIKFDGVSYYEATLKMDKEPTWIREGLNADVEIILEQKNSVLIAPKRFIFDENGENWVYVKNNRKNIKTKVDTGLVGNDGFVEIKNLSEGDVLIVP